MDLKTIREELSRLESLVGGWQAAAEVPAVERDLALELLRRLYEQLRFDAPGAPQPEEAGTGAVEVPESIDLDEMLALEPVAAAAVEEPAAAADDDNEAEAVMKAEEAAAPTPGSPEARAAAAEEAAAETVEVVTATVDEERTDAAGKNVPETPAAEKTAPEEPATATSAAEEVKEVVEASPAVPVSEPVTPAVPAEPAESVQPAVEAAAAEPAVAAETAVEPAVEPAVAAEPAAAPAVAEAAAGSEAGEEEHHAGGRPRAVMGSLFGAEEPVVRHRHRQRVIMSLYGDGEPASGERLSGTGTVRKPAASVAERRMAGLRDEAAGEEARAVSPTASQPAPAAAAEHSVEAAAVKGEAAGQRPETEPSAGPQTEPQNDVRNEPQNEQQTEPEVQPEVAAPEPQLENAAEAAASEPGAGEEEADPFVEVELAPDAIAEKAAPAPEQPEEPEAEPEPESEPEPEPVQSHPAHASHSAGAVPHGAVPGAAPHAHPSAPLAAEGGAVLGEVINHDVRTLADTIAPPRDMASQIARSEPVTDLRRAIGINDRFLMIRDLFGGDADAYERAITALDGCSDLDECMIYIAENYAWNSSSDGARFLMELLERKYA